MGLYNEGSLQLMQGGSITFTSDTIKVRLFLTSDTPNPDSTSMTGIGVTGNDVTITSPTRTKNTTDDRIVFDCADFTFPSQPAGAEVDHVIVFKFITNDASSIPIAYCPITATTPTGADIQVAVASTGLFYLQNG